MKETKFTPGPWNPFVLDCPLQKVPAYVKKAIKASKGDAFYFVTCKKHDGEYDVCHVGNGPTSRENAFLIAAAPDLYEALDAILNGSKTDESFRDDDGILDFGFEYGKERFLERIKAAKAALKKARGKA